MFARIAMRVGGRLEKSPLQVAYVGNVSAGVRLAKRRQT